MVGRTNETWLSDLRSEPPRCTDALEDLRRHLERGIYFYLRNDRSDLSDRTAEAIQQMAQDFAQEAILKILDNLDTFRSEAKFTTWATKIAIRVAISELRRVRWKDYSLDYMTAGGELMPRTRSLSITPDSAPTPENHIERKEVLRMVDYAIENVSTARQRTALRAFAIENVSTKILAEHMNTNRNALYKLVHDARVKIKLYLQAQGLSVEYILSLFE